MGSSLSTHIPKLDKQKKMDGYYINRFLITINLS